MRVSVCLCVKWESCIMGHCERVPNCRDGSVFCENVYGSETELPFGKLFSIEISILHHGFNGQGFFFFF